MVSSFISSGLSNLETWKKTVEECVDTFGWTCCIYHLVTFVFWFPFQVIILDHSNIFIFIWIFFFSFHAAKEAAEGFWWTCSIYYHLVTFVIGFILQMLLDLVNIFIWRVFFSFEAAKEAAARCGIHIFLFENMLRKKMYSILILLLSTYTYKK